MSIGQESQINPLQPAGRTRITVVIHDYGTCLLDQPAIGSAVPVRPAGGRHRVPEPSGWEIADRVLGSWPVALRLAFLFLVLVTGTAVLAAAVGVVGQLVLAGIALRTQRRHKRRMADLRQSMVEAAESV